MMLKAGGNLKQPSTVSVSGGGTGGGTGLGTDIPSTLVGSTYSMSSKTSAKEPEPPASKVSFYTYIHVQFSYIMYIEVRIELFP